MSPTLVGDVAAAAAKPEVPGNPWWLVVLVTGTLLIAGYLWRSGYPPRRRGARPSPRVSALRPAKSD